MSATNKLRVLSSLEKIFGQTLSTSKDSAKFLCGMQMKAGRLTCQTLEVLASCESEMQFQVKTAEVSAEVLAKNQGLIRMIVS
jgi:hypothetical protein